MLDAVNAALDKTNEGSPSSEPGKLVAPAPKAETTKTDVKPEDDLSADELKRLPAKTQKRIRDLLDQRGKAETELADLKPKAAQFETITRQIRETGLDQSDLKVGFNIMTLLKKGDLFGAREAIAPIWEQITKLTGGVLPQDVAAEVTAGTLSEARARELAQARAVVAQNANRQALAQQEGQARQAQEVSRHVVETVNAWEKVKAANDPDWKLKSPEIMRTLKLALLEGRVPANAQQATQMAEEALKEVNARLASYRPAPRAIKAVVGGGGASSHSQAAPKSMLDIVNQTIG